jgi:hypothetical protein
MMVMMMKNEFVIFVVAAIFVFDSRVGGSQKLARCQNDLKYDDVTRWVLQDSQHVFYLRGFGSVNIREPLGRPKY